MKALTVLYDAECARCCRARGWLGRQPTYVRLEFVGAGSAAARARFPGLGAGRTREELTVVGDDGAIYRGVHAWLMCLWALRRHRAWALRLASPALLPLARMFIDRVSRSRSTARPGPR